MRKKIIALLLWSLLLLPVSVRAQAPARPEAPGAASASPARSRLGIRGLFEAAASWPTAAESFGAITGEARATYLGGGVQVTNLWRGLFVQLDVSRATARGERMFLHEGTRYPLGIPVEITMTPVEGTIGYRLPIWRGRLVPYAGGGLGVLTYREASPFAAAGEDVDERWRSWHVVGGVEVPVVRWIAVGAEAHFRSVPDALGEGGVSQIYGEADLGGTSARFRVTVGR